MDGMELDASEVARLVTTFDHAALVAAAGVRVVAQLSAGRIKADMVADATGIGHAPLFPYSIGYETAYTPTGVVARIGPDKDKAQGALGNILYYGTSNNGPVRDIGKGLRTETPKLEAALLAMAAEALE